MPRTTDRRPARRIDGPARQTDAPHEGRRAEYSRPDEHSFPYGRPSEQANTSEQANAASPSRQQTPEYSRTAPSEQANTSPPHGCPQTDAPSRRTGVPPNRRTHERTNPCLPARAPLTTDRRANTPARAPLTTADGRILSPNMEHLPSRTSERTNTGIYPCSCVRMFAPVSTPAGRAPRHRRESPRAAPWASRCTAAPAGRSCGSARG